MAVAGCNEDATQRGCRGFYVPIDSALPFRSGECARLRTSFPLVCTTQTLARVHMRERRPRDTRKIRDCDRRKTKIYGTRIEAKAPLAFARLFFVLVNIRALMSSALRTGAAGAGPMGSLSGLAGPYNAIPETLECRCGARSA